MVRRRLSTLGRACTPANRCRASSVTPLMINRGAVIPSVARDLGACGAPPAPPNPSLTLGMTRALARLAHYRAPCDGHRGESALTSKIAVDRRDSASAAHPWG